MNLCWNRITVPLRYPFHIARAGSSVASDGSHIERVIVSLEHDGVVGLGEAAPSAYYRQSLESVEHTLERASSLLGHDPADIDGIVDRLLDAFDDQRAAVSAIDIALHDWLARRRGLPLWRMLGLNIAKTPPTSMTIGIDRPELLPEKIAQAAAFATLKVKVGTDHDVETLTELSRHAPHQRLRVDANCGWPPDEILDRVRLIERFGIELIEQPTRAGELEAVRWAREQMSIPLFADEDSVRPGDVDTLAGVYDGINVKLAKCGGLREAMRMIARARAAGLMVMLGCMVETSLGIAAAAHIASLADHVDLDGHLLLAEDPYVGLKLVGDVVMPGPAPGLGVRPRGGTGAARGASEGRN